MLLKGAEMSVSERFTRLSLSLEGVIYLRGCDLNVLLEYR